MASVAFVITLQFADEVRYFSRPERTTRRCDRLISAIHSVQIHFVIRLKLLYLHVDPKKL